MAWVKTAIKWFNTRVSSPKRVRIHFARSGTSGEDDWLVSICLQIAIAVPGAQICAIFSIFCDRLTNVEQLLHGPRVAELVRHHRHVVETIEVRQSLGVVLVFDQLLCATVQQSYVRISAQDLFSVELEDQSQHSMSCRMLRTCVSERKSSQSKY